MSDTRKLGIRANADGTVLQAHNPRWITHDYPQEEAYLRRLFNDESIQIDHVGSSAVPGLKTKPAIDICVAIQNDEQLQKIAYSLAGTGYEHKSRAHPGTSVQSYTKKNEEGQTTHLLHLVESGGIEHQRFLFFKRYLAEHLEKMKEYESVKIEADKLSAMH